MACQGIHEYPPRLGRSKTTVGTIVQDAPYNTTNLQTYRKLRNSFPSSASAQDLKDLQDYKNGACNNGRDDEGSNDKPELTKTESWYKHRGRGWRWFSKLWRKGFMKRIPTIPPKSTWSMTKSNNSDREITKEINRCLSSTWKTFTLAEVEAATNNFSPENLIGKGGSAEVYKGRLSDGQFVAIKRLNKGLHEEQVLSFLSEVGILAHINHPNIAKMIGYGVEGGAHLVLQFSSLGSLSSRLHSSDKGKLDWRNRYKIILGIAQGLRYLHENCQRRIIHRDIKVDNILLSEDFEPQICDFGLAKWLPEQWSHRSATKFEGTFGYFAPEYCMHGIIDEKTDVFAFGVLLLEIITGRRAVDESRKNIVTWAKPLLDSNAVVELVDPSLPKNNYEMIEISWVISTAKMCIDETPILRPEMSQVVTLLRGVIEKANMLCRYQSQCHRRTYSDELLYAEEYNSTKYLINTN